MKLRHTILLGLLILFATSCKNDVTPPEIINQNLKIAIVPTFNGNNFSLNEIYINETDYRVAFTKLKFYLSNIKLLKADGSTVDLSEIELFSLEDNEMVKNYIVDTDEFTGNEYSWGVPANLEGSEEDPVNYAAGHPLSLDNGMFWAWNAGYRYTVVEGRFDTNPNGTADLMDPFSWHAGKDILYRTVTETIPFVLDGSGTPQISIQLDLNKLFYNGSEIIDLNDPQESNLAGGNAETFGVKYVGFFIDALSHEYSK